VIPKIKGKIRIKVDKAINLNFTSKIIIATVASKTVTIFRRCKRA